MTALLKNRPSEREIFTEALGIDDPAARRRFVDDACGDDAALRGRVESLLRAHDDAGSFLETPPAMLHDTAAAAETSHPAAGESLHDLPLTFLAPSDKPGLLGTLGPYDVVARLGRGGMGVVLKAVDTRLNRVVAVKVLAPEFAANPLARKRFLREAQAAAAVCHPHVVTIFAVEDQTSPPHSTLNPHPSTLPHPAAPSALPSPLSALPYLVMEYVAGQTLRDKIDHQGPLDVREILRIGSQIAAGLAAAHKQGLIHRDIKPANVLLENGVERVKLTDFGLARAVDDVGVTRDGEVTGTPQFMSPEQAQGLAVDHRSDLFSLGAVLYTMCTGRPPFRGDNTLAVLRRVCDDEPRPIRDLNPDIPDWLAAIVMQLLAKDPAGRLQTATEVSELLGQHLADLQYPANRGTSNENRANAAVRHAGGGRHDVAYASLRANPADDVAYASLRANPADGRRDSSAAPGSTVPASTDLHERQAGSLPHAERHAGSVPHESRWGRRLVAAAALAVVAGLFGVTEATGVTNLSGTVIRFVRGDGTLVVTVDDPQISVAIDGEDLVITGAGPKEIRVRAGEHQLTFSKDGKALEQKLVSVSRGGREVVTAEFERGSSNGSNDAGEGVQFKSYRLKNISAEDALREVKRIAVHSVSAKPQSNSLLVVATPTKHAEVEKRLAEMDAIVFGDLEPRGAVVPYTPKGWATTRPNAAEEGFFIKIYNLKKFPAERALTEVKRILSGEERAEVDPRTNSLIVTAAVSKKPEVDKLIARIDAVAFSDTLPDRLKYHLPPSAQLIEALDKPVSLDFPGVPIMPVLAEISERYSVRFAVDDEGWKEADPEDRLVSLKVDGVSLRTALKLVLDPQRLGYLLDGEQIVVTSKERTDEALKRSAPPGSGRRPITEYQQDFDRVLQVVTGTADDATRKKMLAELHPIFGQLADEKTAAILKVFAALPEPARAKLRDGGYVKWKFADLPKEAQSVAKAVVQSDLDAAATNGVQVPGSLSLAALDGSESGFATVDFGTADNHFVRVLSWFLLLPEHPKPIWVTLVEGKYAGTPEYFEAHNKQLAALRLKPGTGEFSSEASPATASRKSPEARLVEIAETELERAKALYVQRATSRWHVRDMEMNLIRAQIDLAKSGRNRDELNRLFGELIVRLEGQREDQQRLVEEKAASESVVLATEKRIAEAHRDREAALRAIATPNDSQSSRSAPSGEPPQVLAYFDATGAGKGDFYQFNFRYAPWGQVLLLFAERSGLKFDPATAPNDTFNYYDEKPLTREEALDVLNGFLKAKGYVAIVQEGRLSCVKLDDQVAEPVDIEAYQRDFDIVVAYAHGKVADDVALQMRAIGHPIEGFKTQNSHLFEVFARLPDSSLKTLRDGGFVKTKVRDLSPEDRASYRAIYQKGLDAGKLAQPFPEPITEAEFLETDVGFAAIDYSSRKGPRARVLISFVLKPFRQGGHWSAMVNARGEDPHVQAQYSERRARLEEIRGGPIQERRTINFTVVAPKGVHLSLTGDGVESKMGSTAVWGLREGGTYRLDIEGNGVHAGGDLQIPQLEERVVKALSGINGFGIDDRGIIAGITEQDIKFLADGKITKAWSLTPKVLEELTAARLSDMRPVEASSLWLPILPEGKTPGLFVGQGALVAMLIPRTVAAAAQEGANLKVQRTFEAPGVVSAFQVSHNGKLLAVAYQVSDDAVSNDETATQEKPRRKDPVTGLPLNSLMVFDAASGVVRRRFGETPQRMIRLWFSPADDAILGRGISGPREGATMLLRYLDERPEVQFQCPASSSGTTSFLPDGRRFVTHHVQIPFPPRDSTGAMRLQGSSRLWDVDSPMESRVFLGESSEELLRGVIDVQVSPDGTRALLISWDASFTDLDFAVVNIDSKQQLSVWKGEFTAQDLEFAIPTGLQPPMTRGPNLLRVPGTVKWASDGQRICVISLSGQVTVFDAATGGVQSRFPTGNEKCDSIDVTPDGRFVALVKQATRLELWDVARKTRFAHAEPNDLLGEVKFVPDGSAVITGRGNLSSNGKGRPLTMWTVKPPADKDRPGSTPPAASSSTPTSPGEDPQKVLNVADGPSWVTRQLLPLIVQRELLLQNHGPDHPKVRELDKEIEVTRSVLESPAAKPVAESPNQTTRRSPLSGSAEPEPSAILNAAGEAFRAGRYAEALEKYVWYHENAVRLAPSQSAVRLSFALSDWARLADKYPPALAKLKEVRDAAEARTKTALNPFESFQELAAINGYLGEQQRTVEAFIALDAADPARANKAYGVAQSHLVAAGKSELCGKYLRPDVVIDQILPRYRLSMHLPPGSEPRSQVVEDALTSNFKREAATAIALLVLNQRLDEAQRGAEAVKQEIDDARFHEAIDNALKGKLPAELGGPNQPRERDAAGPGG